MQSCRKNWPLQKSNCSGFVKAVAKDLGIALEGVANDICQAIQAAPWRQLGKGTAAAKIAGASALEGKFVVAALSAAGNGHVAVVVDLNAHGAIAYWGRLNSVGKEYAPISQSWNASDLTKVVYAYIDLTTVGPKTRRDYIALGLSGGNFIVNNNPKASGDEPLRELSAFSAVSRNSASIDRAAKETGTDARLIRAVMYMETTHGYYDAPLAWFNKNKSILPMNINVEYWGNAFGDRTMLNDPYWNTRAGALMLARIRMNIAQPTVAKVATLYNNINATQISDYGRRVERIFVEQPWLR